MEDQVARAAAEVEDLPAVGGGKFLDGALAPRFIADRAAIPQPGDTGAKPASPLARQAEAVAMIAVSGTRRSVVPNASARRRSSSS